MSSSSKKDLYIYREGTYKIENEKDPVSFRNVTIEPGGRLIIQINASIDSEKLISTTEQSFERDSFAMEVSEQLGNLLKEFYNEVEV